MTYDDIAGGAGPGTSAAAYPGGNAPWNSGPSASVNYSPPLAEGGGTPPGTNPFTGQPYPAFAGGGQKPATGAVAGPAGVAGGIAGSTSSVYGPDIVLGPDGNIYVASRQYDNQTGGYTYTYALAGPASDLASTSQKSGIPLGMLQAAVAQQQVTLNNLEAQGVINPYAAGGMTQQQLTNALEQVRTAQQYATALSQQTQTGIGGMTYAGLSNLNANNNTLLDYQQNAFLQGKSAVPGMSNADLQYAAQGYGNQASYNQGVNYNAASGVGGMSYGQLGQANSNSQALQNYAYAQNYNTQNPYSGMSNGATGLAANNAENAANLNGNTWLLGTAGYTDGATRQQYQQATNDIQNQLSRQQSAYSLANIGGDEHLQDLNRAYDTAAQAFNLGTAGYTNGATRQQYVQGTTDLTNQYGRADATYKLAHQGNQQALDTYREGVSMDQSQRQGQSRQLAGMGWAAIQRPAILGWQ